MENLIRFLKKFKVHLAFIGLFFISNAVGIGVMMQRDKSVAILMFIIVIWLIFALGFLYHKFTPSRTKQ